MPHISVIIPTHNRRETLLRAIASVLEQSYKDFDLWIIDDASNDGTSEELLKLSQQYQNVHFLLNETNRGVSFSRNRGVEASQGQWLALLDSDDEWLPHKLERQMELFESDRELRFIHSEEAWLRLGKKVEVPMKYKKIGGEIFDECFELCRISPSTVLIHRELFLRHGLFREDFPVCEDFELWLRLTRRNRLGFINEALTVKHGGHADQLSMRFHSMDYWRVRALSSYLVDYELTSEIALKLRQTLVEKCRILLKGYEKHQNLTNYDEIAAIMKAANPL